MALHVPETLHVKALRLWCCTLYDTARRYLYRPTTIMRGKSSRKKKGIDQVFGLFLEQSCYASTY